MHASRRSRPCDRREAFLNPMDIIAAFAGAIAIAAIVEICKAAIWVGVAAYVFKKVK